MCSVASSIISLHSSLEVPEWVAMACGVWREVFRRVCLTVTCDVMDTLPFSKEHGTEQLTQADSVMSC